MADNDNNPISRSGRSDLGNATPIQRAVHEELDQYFFLLDGEPPKNLHLLVMGQVEMALLNYVMTECRGNQSRASHWLGISRGTLRTKLRSKQDKISNELS